MMKNVALMMRPLLITVLVTFSIPIADAFARPVETTALKRLGKKSFIEKQDRGTLQEITSPGELKEIACSYSQRQPGSSSYFKGWQHWKMLAIESIRYDLSNNLPYQFDKAKFENLFFRLGVAADMGEMPSFSDPGARSGYALEFFCRARNLADLYIDALNPSLDMPQNWVESMKESPMLAGDSQDTRAYEMVSIGGGPGFDFVGSAMVASFATHTFGEEAGSRAIQATVFDYEEGWGDLVKAMDISTRRVLQQSKLSCRWGGGCDITKSLDDPSNAGCLEAVKSTDLWICQYCVAENAIRLKESDYIFFRELFQHAKEGSVFVLTETHPRVWPEFYKLMKAHCAFMEIGFRKNGRQMLVRKSINGRQKTPLISNKDLELVKKFESIGKFHERKLNSGWERQEKKHRR
ncbi:unnamed protein product [Cylindrotheca closterium]|uniref:Uncharacterized protein n=1 Tax=Cylindrotheca closterium TaxID=2856 RepID=A0AAD2G4L3_9STRA|nr:unnamed protein product [Cylindrotheca closterium]